VGINSIYQRDLKQGNIAYEILKSYGFNRNFKFSFKILYSGFDKNIQYDTINRFFKHARF